MKSVKSVFAVIIVLCTLIAAINSLVLYLDIYSTFNWVVDYRFGFCKRGFLGTLYHLFLKLTASDWNFDTLQSHIFLVHLLLSLLSIVLLILFFFQLSKTIEEHKSLFLSFLFLVCSFFIKNAFSLTGYMDLWLFVIFLIVLFLLYKNKTYTAICLASLSCLFTELSCLFWLPLFVAIVINRKSNAHIKIFPLLVPFAIGVLIHFCGVPYENLHLFYQDFAFPISSTIESSMGDLFASQYSILDTLKKMYNYVLANLLELTVSYFILAGIVVFYYILNFRISTYPTDSVFVKFLKQFMVISCFIAPLLLIFVAIDFWRFAGFTVFAAFLFSVSNLIFRSNNIQSDPNLLNCELTSSYSYTMKFSAAVGIVISLVSLFIPPLRTYGTFFIPVTPEVLSYIADNKKFVFSPIIYKGEIFNSLIARFNYGLKPVFRNQTANNLQCSENGSKFLLSPQAYGKVKISIQSVFDSDDPDKEKYLYIMEHRIAIPRNSDVDYVIEFSPANAGKYPNTMIEAEPSSHGWVISDISFYTTDDNA